VIDHFREMSQSSSHQEHSGGGAGRTFLAHQAGAEFHFVLQREKWMPLMKALRDDALQQLANSGAEVLSQSGDPRDGFRFDYKINKSFGSLTITPLSIAPHWLTRRDQVSPDGTVDATVKIEQTEKWFPKGFGGVQLSVTSSFH